MAKECASKDIKPAARIAMGWKRILSQKRPAAGGEARERASFLWVSVENRQSLCYTRRHRGGFGGKLQIK